MTLLESKEYLNVIKHNTIKSFDFKIYKRRKKFDIKLQKKLRIQRKHNTDIPT